MPGRAIRPQDTRRTSRRASNTISSGLASYGSHLGDGAPVKRLATAFLTTLPCTSHLSFPVGAEPYCTRERILTMILLGRLLPKPANHNRAVGV